MKQDPTTPPDSPLRQAFATLIALLIAAIAEHAAEHPLLAPGLRATIRQLEALAVRLDAMVTEWEATRHTPRRNRHARRGARLAAQRPSRALVPSRHPARPRHTRAASRRVPSAAIPRPRAPSPRAPCAAMPAARAPPAL